MRAGAGDRAPGPPPEDYQSLTRHSMAPALCEVVLIAGFLGAGKTTFLRHILGWPGNLADTAILVNEFGELGIDGELLEGSGTPVVELANGCICCSLQGDLLRTLDEILVRFCPRLLLIEATGVADPLDILKVLRLPRFQPGLKVTKVVTVVDVDFWEARENFGSLFDNQIKAADLVLLNKIDLQEPALVSRYLAEIREVSPACALLPTCHCQIDPEVLRGLTGAVEPSQAPPLFLPDLIPPDLFPHLTPDSHRHPTRYVAFSFESSTPFREGCFRELLEALPPELYRIKGYVLLGERRFFLNHVGGKSEWAESQEPGPTRLALVGWQVDAKQILSRLERCLES